MMWFLVNAGCQKLSSFFFFAIYVGGEQAAVTKNPYRPKKQETKFTFRTIPPTILTLTHHTMNVVECNVLQRQTLTEVQDLERSFGVASAQLAANDGRLFCTRGSHNKGVIGWLFLIKKLHQFIAKMLYLYLRWRPSTRWHHFLGYSVKLIIHT